MDKVGKVAIYRCPLGLNIVGCKAEETEGQQPTSSDGKRGNQKRVLNCCDPFQLLIEADLPMDQNFHPRIFRTINKEENPQFVKDDPSILPKAKEFFSFLEKAKVSTPF